MTFRFAQSVSAAVAAFTLLVSSSATAADGYEILYQGYINQLGEATEVVAADWVDQGREPVNGDWAYVYDPEFYFYLTGSGFGPDRTPEFADKGYVIVAAAGDPGGTYYDQPYWFDFTQLSASYDPLTPQFDLAISYTASYVPTLRGFQNFIVYVNYDQVAPSSELVVYDSDRAVWPRIVSGLRFGSDRYLLTGDGLETQTVFTTYSPDAFAGPAAMEVRVEQDAGQGTHWKLMLFANGHAAAFDGIDLSGYDRLVFHAKASRDVFLQGGFGTGDDSDQRAFAPLALTTSYQRFEIDLTGLDLTDINSLLWVYLHRSLNPFDLTGVSVFLDNVKFLKAEEPEHFVTQDGPYVVGEQIGSDGQLVHIEVLRDSASSYLTPFGSGPVYTSWIVDRAQAHTHDRPLLLNTVVFKGLYVQDCVTQEWVNASETVFAPIGESLTVYNGWYYTNHFFQKTVMDVLLDERFACVTDGSTYVDVMYEGAPHSALTKGRVQFAYVVEHR